MSVADKLQVKKERRLALADAPLSIEAPSKRLRAEGLTPLRRAEYLAAALRALL